MEPKHIPVPVEDMEIVSPKNSICQVIRDIYHETEDENIRLKCRLACAMGKSMSEKITELSGDNHWFKTFWDDREE